MIVMGMQKFLALESENFANGAVGWKQGGPTDCLGPFAKVQNCPIHGFQREDGSELRLTCYATDYPDTYFSVPASTRYKGKYVGGYFTVEDGNVEFRPYAKYHHLLPGGEQ